MSIIVDTSSMVPIYEQIVSQITSQIACGILKEGDVLPSVRMLANDLKISALTVKKAYDALETDSLIQTVHGKGSFVKAAGTGLLKEARLKMAETEFEKAVQKAVLMGISENEIREIMNMLLEEHYDHT